MNTGKMRRDDSNELNVLLVAMEMGAKSWRLAMAPYGATKHRQVTVTAGHYLEVQQAVRQARERFGLARLYRVIFCYEAGRDGFHP